MRSAMAWPLAGAMMVAFGTGAASAASLNAQYAISLAGLPIGTADLTANLEGDGYKMDIQARLTGLAGAITGGSEIGRAHV